MSQRKRTPQPLSLEELEASLPVHLRRKPQEKTGRRVEGRKCDWCGNKHYAKGMCFNHYLKDRSDRIRSGELVPQGHGIAVSASGWKGGISFTPEGRVLCYREWHPLPSQARRLKHGCYVLRYRLVIEHHLGRFLRKGEIVHHVNGDPTDDRLENLQICDRSSHAKTHKMGACGNKWRKVMAFTLLGDTKTMHEWSVISGIPQQVLRDRIRRGKTLLEVITENKPIRGRATKVK